MESGASNISALRSAGMRLEAKDRLAVALDFPTSQSALALVDRLEGQCRWFKVGMELFYTAGAGLVHTLRDKGFDVFLDLKLHDIPNTVAGAVRSATSTGASLLTIHASGGTRMMLAAVEAAQAVGSPGLLAVTVLTSMDEADLQGTGVASTPREHVLRLAHLAQSCGVFGIVCSSEEVSAIRDDLGPTPFLVVPGIRPTGTSADDQRRIASPGAAIRDGASMLVVGRPITQSSDPARAAEAILSEIEAAIPTL